MVSVSSNPVDLSSHGRYLPDQILILGGGRWARVIAEVMCNLLPSDIPLIMCSPRGFAVLSDWASEQGVEGRVSVQKQRPKTLTASTAVIVANAADDHATAGWWALAQGAAAVLIEKPLAASAREVQQLIDFSHNCSGLLAAAHVLRFANYLHNFAHALSRTGRILSVNVEWIDPVAEYRYGEAKRYDPRVPVYVDCVPHIVAILQTLFNVLPQPDGAPMIDCGGARVTIPLSLSGLSCSALVQRNGSHRLRRVTVESSVGNAILDFSTEPGVIRVGKTKICGDPAWHTSPTPLTSLLKTFLVMASEGKFDSRLSLDTALTAALITESVTPVYKATVVPWLVEQLISKHSLNDDTYYAVSEILQFNSQQSRKKPELLALVTSLRQRLRKSSFNMKDPQFMIDHIRHLAGS